MKVKFVGFGGYMEVPCYEDENGKLYFDENNGRNGLDLYTGAYKEEWGEICGEPNTRITEEIECDEPFVRHSREFDYMMLDRYKTDCEYFLVTETDMKVVCISNRWKNTVMKWKSYGIRLLMMKSLSG